ncbi:nuclear transport factor 2 family protein [Mycolicibacterium peregrinum]|uniref:limonene-1,2-epoxide hydrolase family protein n=1 Tax=Mycolicibacterium peregrinum TaxID=43304 RepID=UPI0006D7AAFE|nr:limonene-1,2-epoxide hydrolase family protein [Mycolicibacterium peregrinum]MCV7202023.1 nuclear transport factor 2 family protein [Mycolicibacterium peregrinum]ORW61334.1 limonene-1,2-epoxide hydrolase [Mycolicibacterium peregrinum]
MPDQSTTATQTPTATVETFLNALQEQDFDTAETTLAQNLVYQNVGFPTIYGRNRAVKLFRSMPAWMGFEVKIHRIAADGAAVLTERTDALTFGPLRLQFWVCGVFEVHEGRITLWRDYFDMFDMVKATVRGLVGVVVPSLRPSL